MKKLLLFSLISLAIPVVAMQNVPSAHTPGMYIHPMVNRFTDSDKPESPIVLFFVHDDKPQITDYKHLPSWIDSEEAQSIDSNGRNVIWWIALMGKKNLYNELIKIGANPDIKSTKGLLAGYSARELIEMTPEEIEIAMGVATKQAKL